MARVDGLNGAFHRPSEPFVSNDETRVLSRAFHSMITGTKYRIEMPRESFEATFRRAAEN